MGAREVAFSAILQRLYGAPTKVPRARLADLPPSAQREILRAYRSLGGVLDIPVLAPGNWDFAFAGGLLFELDEDLHFNRYRASTFNLPWSEALPWSSDYRRHCLVGEEMCMKSGRFGARWTSAATSRMFGAGDPPGVLTSRGSPRWKQRALYDAIKDAVSVHSGQHRLARISIHDVISGVSVNDLLHGKRKVSESAVHEFLAARTTIFRPVR
ncbi:DUF7255 family protein [Arthrobacter sp. MA-N2]|uniref:DUF7255 family protein n=1 Tax=Arthrobacter sp. MA-N2 TaxID=1101188 RepID=UPI003FA4224E